ncbi:MAG: transcriptional regulator GcvA [Burkholderiales bacterium]|nr:transcriptional regulator GcvA [Burkholderiales bacterium]
MHKTLRRLPSLDFLRGFEAAGRRLSFTLAAEELFVTQSALSRQVKALEDALGVPLFERRHRALALTAAGAALHRRVSETLRDLAAAADEVQSPRRDPGLTVSTTVSFAALWLIPRLSSFRAESPGADVYVSAEDRVVDLARGNVDVAVRYLADASAYAGAVHLFGERLVPVASPALVERGPPLSRPADLARHILLAYDDAAGLVPWLHWSSWLAANGAPELKPAGTVRFSHYDQVIQAAVAGQGVALGRLPLIARLVERGDLVTPFGKRYDSPRGYYAVTAPHAVARPEVRAFVAWLRREAETVAKPAKRGKAR